MGAEGRKKTAEARVRRARREDIAALVECVGGPPAGRVRALRRLLKTLVSDVYVIDRAGAITGVVALHYRRSLAHGGLAATIDVVQTMGPADDTSRGDLASLVQCALLRAKRRGCVGIDCSVSTADVREALHDNGFKPGPTLLGRSLRMEEDEG